MASKNQKFKSYSENERNIITMEYINGKGSYKYLADKYDLSWKTVETWVRKYRQKGTTQLLTQGRPKQDKNMSELERLRLENEILKKFQAFLKEQDKKK